MTAPARDAGVRVWKVEALGGHPIERLSSLIALTDYTAPYLALGLDPAVSRHVTELRDRTRWRTAYCTVGGVTAPPMVQ